MIPVIWRSRIVGYMPEWSVPRGLPVVFFPVMPRIVYADPGTGLSPNANLETVAMRVNNDELHVDSLQHLRKLRGFSPEDRWLKLLAEADADAEA